jgi:DNA-binding MarR family transcriptional regulator
MNKLVKSVPRRKIYFEYLQSLNGILNLSYRELEVMAKLVEVDVNTVVKPGDSKNVINTQVRKTLMKELGFTPDNLCRLISKLKKMGYIKQGFAEDEWEVNKILIPEIISDRVQISIVLKVDDAAEKH